MVPRIMMTEKTKKERRETKRREIEVEGRRSFLVLWVFLGVEIREENGVRERRCKNGDGFSLVFMILDLAIINGVFGC